MMDSKYKEIILADNLAYLNKKDWANEKRKINFDLFSNYVLSTI